MKSGGGVASDQLGPPYTAGPVTIQPPKPTEPIEAPQGLTAAFEGGDPACYLLLLAQAAQGNIEEFVKAGLQALKQAGYGTPAEPAKMDDQTSGSLTFNLYSLQGDRDGVTYDWYIYFTETGGQHVMVAFVFPHDQFEQFGQAMVTSLGTLKVSSGEQAETKKAQ
jgi:hypothetical protein